MRLPISICLISKNEEKNIEKCLTALKKLNCEIIVTDTGSEDDTVNIASKLADRVGHFNWINDFSAAKNYSASLASNDYILSIDCDEFLESFDVDRILSLINAHPKSLGTISLRSVLEGTDGSGKDYINERLTRFYNRRFYAFKGAVHETLSPVIDTVKQSYIDLPLSFLHTGYESAEYRKKKSEKYLAMLLEERSKQGPSPYNCYQIAKCYRSMNNNSAAAKYLSEGLSYDIDPALVYLQDMVEIYGYTLLDLKRFDEALGLESIYETFAKRSDFVFLMGLIYMNNALFDRALSEFDKATKMTRCSAEGTNSYKAYYNIGVIHEVMGNAAEAAIYYKKSGAYPPALDRLRKIE